MPVGNFTAYGNAKLQLTKKAIDLSADTFVMVLLTASYTPNANTDAAWSTLSGNELATAGGYTAGGVVIASLTDALAAGVVTWGGASSTWAAFTATFKYAAIIRRAGGSLVAGDIPMAYFDASTGGGSITGGGGTLTITDASGFLTVT